MRVPRPVLVGAVADRLLVNVDALPSWNHLGSGETVWTCSGGEDGTSSEQFSSGIGSPASFGLAFETDLFTYWTLLFLSVPSLFAPT